MVKDFFNKEYTQYWKKSIQNSIDGTIIPGPYEVVQYFKHLNINNFNTILDLGCSYGRMFETLSSIGNEIYGCDIDPYAAIEAGSFSYKKIETCSSNQLLFTDNFFDFIFCWAVFDVLDQKSTLIEMNRVLKNDSFVLLTAKNSNYFKDDNLAYEAEKNASNKNFPNKFINLKKLINTIEKFGFIIKEIFLFHRRGDIGLVKFHKVENIHDFDDRSYEFLILLKKKSIIKFTPNCNFSSNYSEIAIKNSTDNGYINPKIFFKEFYAQ